jgi:hypothetical protein
MVPFSVHHDLPHEFCYLVLIEILALPCLDHFEPIPAVRQLRLYEVSSVAVGVE